MKRVFLQIADLAGSAWYRQDAPGRRCYEVLKEEGIELMRDIKLNVKEDYAAWCFHKVPTEGFMPYLRELKKRGRIIWNCDDLLSGIPEHLHHPNYDAAFLDRYWEMVELSDLIVTTQPVLSWEMGRVDKCVVAPNLIDLDLLSPGPKSDKVKIVWAGGSSHGPDLDLIAWTTLRLLQKYPDEITFSFFGEIPSAVFSEWYNGGLKNVEYNPGVFFDQYFPALKALGGHIGLAPLVANRFNSCRSNLKWLEYSAVGMVTVAQEFDPYSDITNWHNGVTVYDDEWETVLSRLIEDKNLRQELSERAYEEIKANWSWQSESAKGKWLDVYRMMVNGQPCSPSAK